MTRAAVTHRSTRRAGQGPLQIGARFLDKYEIRGELGHGGQASIYLGQHLFTAREVAIKIIHSPHGVTREMLVRGKSEARALGKLDHPNIVVMHDAGITDEGLFYIVMERLRGQSLRAVLAGYGRLRVDELLRLAIQAGEAVQAAHEVEMIHRDLKPDNLYVIQGNRLKVLDFGIAKMRNEIGFTTRKNMVVGSLLYMSPEQVLGQPIAAPSDVYALGLMMFEALIGMHPSLLIFERDLRARNAPHRQASLADIAPIQVSRMPPLLSELEPDIPRYVAEVVQRAIAKVARDRFPSMRDFVSALRACLEAVGKEPPTQSGSPRERDLWDGSRSVAAWTPASTIVGFAPPLSRGAEPEVESAVDASASITLDMKTTEAAATRATGPLNVGSAPPVAVDLQDGTLPKIPIIGLSAHVRNAIIGVSLAGVLLCVLGAFMHFGAAKQAAAQAPELASTPGGERLTGQRPEAPAALAAEVVSAVPSLAPPAPALPAPAPHVRTTPGRASAPPSPNDSRRKRINGGRPIYGD